MAYTHIGKRACSRNVAGERGYRVYKSMIESYLTTGQASNRFGLSQAHIRRLLGSGTLDGVKMGRDWLVLTTSVEGYVASRSRLGRKSGRGGNGNHRRGQQEPPPKPLQLPSSS